MDEDLLARIDENVKYLRLSFDDHKKDFKEHIHHDEKIETDFIKPLWEAHNRQAGATKMLIAICSFIASALTLVIMWITGVVSK
jgi:hypothetical protein